MFHPTKQEDDLSTPEQPPPRVQLELRLVVGVLADLSGQPGSKLPRLADRPFVWIDRDNFNKVLRQAGPQVQVRVPNRLGGGARELDLTLAFQSLDDFTPAAVARQVPALRELLDRRQRLQSAGDRNGQQELADIDWRLTRQLAEVLHHPAFQRLESTWRGLRYLARQAADKHDIEIQVCNVSKQELAKDLERAVEYDQSQLFKKVHEERLDQPGAFPFTLLVADYEFGHQRDDVALLRGIAGVASSAHTPFVASASPSMLGMKHFAELHRPRNLARIVKAAEYADWHKFRRSSASAYVGLTVPRVLARLPYGKDTLPVVAFPFEEMVEGIDHEKYLWTSAAWAFGGRVMTAFARDGWLENVIGAEGGGRVEGLPAHIFPTEGGDVELKCPTEVGLSAPTESRLAALGFLPLSHWKNTDFAVFRQAPSCHQPGGEVSEGRAAEGAMSRLNVLLCGARFMHALRLRLGDRMDPRVSATAHEEHLHKWLLGYTNTSEEVTPEMQARFPLRDFEVSVRDVPGSPGAFRLTARLRPRCLSGQEGFPWLRFEAVVRGPG